MTYCPYCASMHPAGFVCGPLRVQRGLRGSFGFDPTSVVLHEHACAPPSYMARSHLVNIVANANLISSMLNADDQLPEWVTDKLTRANQNIQSALDYIRGQKMQSR